MLLSKPVVPNLCDCLNVQHYLLVFTGVQDEPVGKRSEVSWEIYRGICTRKFNIFLKILF